MDPSQAAQIKPYAPWLIIAGVFVLFILLRVTRRELRARVDEIGYRLIGSRGWFKWYGAPLWWDRHVFFSILGRHRLQYLGFPPAIFATWLAVVDTAVRALLDFNGYLRTLAQSPGLAGGALLCDLRYHSGCRDRNPALAV